MEKDQEHLIAKRLCNRCKKPLEEEAHGNRKSHPDCESRYKKQHQKEKYKVGNTAKLLIQKNETVAAYLYKLDPQKRGISYLVALEHGLKFDCPSIIRERFNKKIFFFDKYGYTIEIVNDEHLIFICHESDL